MPVMLEKEKARLRADTENKPIFSIPHSRENNTYIFSERVDRAIDRLVPWIWGLTAVYFLAQVARAVMA